MEIPRHWRETPTNICFTGIIRESAESEMVFFKYPGGQVMLNGTDSEVMERFLAKGFEVEVVEEILSSLGSAITSETAVPARETVESLKKFVGSEVGK